MVTTTDRPASNATTPVTATGHPQPVEWHEPIVLRLPPEWRLTDDMLTEISDLNDLQFERTVEGDLVITLPPHGRAPRLGARVVAQLLNWADAGGGGDVADSSGGYLLDDPLEDAESDHPGVIKAPVVSWISQEQLDGMSDEEVEDGYPRLCPTFVVEIVSAQQRVAPQHQRMAEWIESGAQLGWLIDPQQEKVWIYRLEQKTADERNRPETLSGEGVLEGFVLDCWKLWR